MGWLIGQVWLWLLLTVLLGAVITFLLTMRKLEITTLRPRPATTAPDAEVPPVDADLEGATAIRPLGEVDGPEGETMIAEPDVAQPEITQPEIEEPATAEPVVAEPVSTVSDAAADEVLDVARPTAGRYAGSADPMPDGTAPEGYDIKGNETSGLFHTTESPYFGRTRADVWFDSEDSAVAAGFTRWDQRDRVDAAQAEPETEPEPEPEPESEPESSETPTASPSVPADGSYGAGSAAPLEDGASPHDSFTIKGTSDSMLFHTDESPYYDRTRAEVWFSSEDTARAAGFTRWDQTHAVDDPAPEPASGPAAEPDAEPDAGLASVPEGAFGAGSADPLEDGEAPEGFTVKGDADSMLFHTDESPFYGRTKAEVWFSSEDAARAAGFTRWDDD